jgi:hypothetical protein
MCQFHLQRLEVDSLLPAFEDGTDTWFRNVGTVHIDAGEIPKRTFTIFKSRRKLEMYNGTECSETSAYKIQKPGNYPEESIKQEY